ncbi:SDR family NAD(P)-dependent oxidoreductase [Pedobacter sp. B4-66]|uniref:SDR family oxidoreductase n=1 Tax=Pedobacter sp. B4-66 TaxID=2817280 RepID=UPI001BD9FF26|nr:SDR family NAD(P)-dependent oxidoreductase [Pedobacter sp. B4-66]
MKLSGNKILITGATSGIGKALTEKFLQLDNHIIAVGRNEIRLEELSRFDYRITAFKCNISSQSELDQLVDFIKREHKDLNVLINNAGIQYNCNFLDETYGLQKIENEINTNLTAPIKLISSLLPVLQDNSNSAIVNISSGLAIVPKANSAVYCGTKAGIHIFSKSLRYQLDKVKVFEIIPPMVDTEMTKGRGKGKISPERLVEEFIKAFKNNRYEVNIHKVKLLRIINRIIPKLADRLIVHADTKQEADKLFNGLSEKDK